MTKLVVIGLDCATPQLLFDAWLDELPNLKKLVEAGMHGELHSTIPPITVPAWTAMMTSQDPGMLGFYGFRNRKGYGYDELYSANASYVKAKTVWNMLSRNRLSSLVFGVPQTYPPKPLNGMMVSSFLTPDKSVDFTYPPELKSELDSAADGDYIIDVRDFRTDEKQRLIDEVYEMTRRRFKAFIHFLSKDDFDFAMMVEMGIDRIHHGFWRYFDTSHRLYEPGNQYENVIKDYYKYVDGQLGRVLDVISPETSVLVVSDHGAKTMVGAICINEWLMQEGYLTLHEQPDEPKRLTTDMIDWSRTMAWGEGGYYSRLFMNVAGREPEGIVPQDDYDRIRDEIKAKLESIEDESGQCIGTRALKPEEVYRSCTGIPPDLVVYLGNLDWRSAGSVGTGSVYLYENDTGPDDANHAEDGILIWRIPGREPETARTKFSIYDVAPSILKFYGIEPSADMIGTSII